MTCWRILVLTMVINIMAKRVLGRARSLNHDTKPHIGPLHGHDDRDDDQGDSTDSGESSDEGGESISDGSDWMPGAPYDTQVSFSEVIGSELYSPARKFCGGDAMRRRSMMVMRELNSEVDAWSSLISGLCASYVPTQSLNDDGSAFWISSQNSTISRFDANGTLANATVISAWKAHVTIFVANETVLSSSLSEKLGREQRDLSVQALHEAVLFSIADQPNNATGGLLGVALRDEEALTRAYPAFAGLTEELQSVFGSCSLPDITPLDGGGGGAGAGAGVYGASSKATFVLTSYASSLQLQQYLDRLTLSLRYRYTGSNSNSNSNSIVLLRSRRQLEENARWFPGDVVSLMTETARRSAALYGAQQLLTSVLCADRACTDAQSLTLLNPTMAPTAQPTTASTTASTTDSLSAQCGLVCEYLNSANDNWGLYGARYAAYAPDTASPGSGEGPTSTATTSSSSSSSRGGLGLLQPSAFLVWLGVLGFGWLSVLVYWAMRTRAGYARGGRTSSTSGASSFSSYIRDLVVTCSGGGVYTVVPDSNSNTDDRQQDYHPGHVPGQGLSILSLRCWQSGLVLTISVARLAYLVLLVVTTTMQHLPSFVCVELAPYGLQHIAGLTGALASPAVLVLASSFAPLFLMAVLVRKAMLLQLMRLLNLGYGHSPTTNTRLLILASSGPELPLFIRGAFALASVAATMGVLLLASTLVLSSLSSTAETWTPLTQPLCLATIITCSASTLLLQLSTSACFLPSQRYLLGSRLGQEQQARRRDFIAAMQALYGNEDLPATSTANAARAPGGAAGGNQKLYYRAAGAGSDDEDEDEDEDEGENGGEDGGEEEGRPRGAAAINTTTPSFSSSSASFKGARIGADVRDGVAGSCITVTAGVAVLTSLPALSMGHWWVGLLLYSGALRVLEMVCAALLMGDIPVARSSMRRRLVVSVRERMERGDIER